MKNLKTKLLEFLWDTFSDDYFPWRDANFPNGHEPNLDDIDVVIPCCYRHKDRVENAIKSVASYPFVKNIIVNAQDCELSLSSLKSKYPKLKVVPSVPQIPSKARNYCLLSVESDYIFYLDADDTVENLWDMYNLHKQYPNMLIAPNNLVAITNADMMFGCQSSMLVPKWIGWADLPLFEDCATYLGFQVKISEHTHIHRTYLKNGARNNNVIPNLMKYFIWLCGNSELPIMEYIHASKSKYKKLFIKELARYLSN